MTAECSAGDESRQRQRLKQAILAQVVEEAIHVVDQKPCVLTSALDLSAALEGLGMGSSHEPGPHQEWLAGAAACPLGVQPEQLEAQLPNTPRIQEAVQQLLPEIEGRLAERCKQLAAAANYDSSSYDGLADHLRQLDASADRRPEVQSWQRAAGAAEQALRLLAEANEVLVTIVSQFKLNKQKEADEAKAAFLHAQCSMLLEKLRVVEGQLRVATYSQAAVPALRRVAEHLDAAVTEAVSKLREASTRLAQYRALGPRFEALAREHATVQQQMAETQYQLQEVEEFARLQQVLG